MKTPSQILDKYEGHEGLSLNDDRVRIGRQRVIMAMQEYASQYQCNHSQSEKEMEEKIINILKNRIRNLIADDLISPLFYEDFAREIMEVNDIYPQKCSHVIPANGNPEESCLCIKCGKKVCEISKTT